MHFDASLRQTVARVLREHWWLLVLTLSVLDLAIWIQVSLPAPGLLRDLRTPHVFQLWALLSGFWLWASLPAARLAVRDGHGRYLSGWRGWPAAWRRARRTTLSNRRIASAMVGGLLLVVLINVVSSWKRYFPNVAPFTWDRRLAAADLWLHGGRYPHEWLFPWLRSDAVTAALDIVYSWWALVVGMSMAWWLWRHDSPGRRRVLGGFAFVWLGLGMVAATFFSSAGPCFFGAATGVPDPYLAHMTWLHEASARLHLEVPTTQRTMWLLHTAGQAPLYFGISSMPSLHVAVPTLFAFAAWSVNRPMAVLMWAFTAVTLLATVHLGWHYAIDGYVSILCVGAYWLLSGRIMSVS